MSQKKDVNSMAFRKLHGFWLILVIIIIALIVLWFLKAPIMSSYLSRKMKVKVSMLAITLRPSYTKIYRFHISNPRGSKTRTAFSSKKITIRYSWKKLRQTPTVIDEIVLDDIYLGIEFYNPLGTDNNWSRIFAKMKEDEQKEKGKGGGVIIRKLVLNNIEVAIYGMGLKGLLGQVQKKKIPQIVFHDINSKEGFPTAQLIEEIFGSLGIQKFIKDLLSPEKIFKKIPIPIKIGKEDETKKPPSEKSEKAA